jgi:uncharacterized damage-inducible protein DinB
VSARDTLLAELDHEMAVTRHVLERVPEHAFDWKPHEQSFSLGALASHLAQLPHWGRQILDQDSYDLETATGRTTVRASRAAVLEAFDAHVLEVRSALTGLADAELAARWTLKRGGHTVLAIPRVSALRRFLIHHVIHHRGQMTVYLRLQNVPVPPIYGPTADESV